MMSPRRLLTLLVAFWLACMAQPGWAAVTMTFWSHDQDKDFPHAFFTLQGTPDAGGAAIDANYGFTAKTITPAILLGNVAGDVMKNSPAYMKRSDAQFSVVLSDAQLTAVQALIAGWSSGSGDSKYNLNKRNCVHFIAEAARRAGLDAPDIPSLMKKPKTFLLAVAQANAGRVTAIHEGGAAYLAAHRVDPASAPVMATAH